MLKRIVTRTVGRYVLQMQIEGCPGAVLIFGVTEERRRSQVDRLIKIADQYIRGQRNWTQEEADDIIRKGMTRCFTWLTEVTDDW